MIQFNLLPDVKLEYVRAQRTKHTVISTAVIAAGSAFLIFLLLFLAVHVVQAKSINDLNNDIKKYSTQLKNTPDLDKILTIQSQLAVLPKLHADKAAASRTFTFIQQITPPTVTLTDVTTDYAAHTITITGLSASLDNVNTLVDTMKFTKYSTKDTTDQKAFTGVVMSEFTRVTKSATFTVTANYDPAIFDNASDVSLKVPNGISTSSVVGQPTNLFQKTVTPDATNTNGNKQ
jgi:Tfp pilus assembly protein PilN